MNQTVQRILSVFAVILIVVVFYQYKSNLSEQSRLKDALANQSQNVDSLSGRLINESQEKGLLKAENELKKLEIGRANQVLASVLANMDDIAKRESEARSLIQQNNPERRGRLISTKDYRKIDHEINSYLEVMYNTLNMSRQRVAELEGEMENALDDNEQLKSFITNLRRMVDSQEQTIVRLKEEKQTLLLQLGQYEEENQALRKAWVTIGAIDDLRKRQIVRKPFLRPTEINALDSTKFQNFDIRETKISLGDKPLKDINILTDHKKYPEFFELSKDGKSLTIKDPTQFWLVSKFLIVEVQY